MKESVDDELPVIVDLQTAESLQPAADGLYTAAVRVHFRTAPGRGIAKLHMTMTEPAFDEYYAVSGGESLDEGNVQALFRFGRPPGRDALVVSLSVIDTAGAESLPTTRAVDLEPPQ